jgi:hypothetical protein
VWWTALVQVTGVVERREVAAGGLENARDSQVKINLEHMETFKQLLTSGLIKVLAHVFLAHEGPNPLCAVVVIATTIGVDANLELGIERLRYRSKWKDKLGTLGNIQTNNCEFFWQTFHALAIPSHPSLDIQAGGGDRVVNLPRLSHVHKRPWLGLDKTGRSLCAVKARQRVASVQLRVFFARAA